MFSAALASGQLGPLMSQFGLPAEAVDAANKGGEYPVGIGRKWFVGVGLCTAHSQGMGMSGLASM